MHDLETASMLHERGWTPSTTFAVWRSVIMLDSAATLLTISSELDGDAVRYWLPHLATVVTEWPTTLPPNPEPDLWIPPLIPSTLLTNPPFRRALQHWWDTAGEHAHRCLRGGVSLTEAAQLAAAGEWNSEALDLLADLTGPPLSPRRTV